jgi:hypothetical protein
MYACINVCVSLMCCVYVRTSTAPIQLVQTSTCLDLTLSSCVRVCVCVCVFDEEAELEGLDAFKGMMSSAGSRLKVRHYLI